MTRCPFGGQQCTATIFRTTPAGVLRFEFWGVALVDDESVVVIQFLTSLDLFNRFDKNVFTNFIRFTIGVA